MQIDVRVAQLLCSRMCHDLIGPVGAINAGMELEQEADGENTDALSLVARSARQATNRLSFFRIAFGLKTGIEGVMEMTEIRDLTNGLLVGGKVNLEWPDKGDWGENRTVSLAAAQLVLNLVLLGLDCLPRGGSISVRFADLAGKKGSDAIGAALTASGTGARVRNEVRTVMQPTVPMEVLSARTIHGHWAALLAAALGTAIEVTDGTPDEVRLAVLLSSGSGLDP